jgi:hypothetical protein
VEQHRRIQYHATRRHVPRTCTGQSSRVKPHLRDLKLSTCFRCIWLWFPMCVYVSCMCYSSRAQLFQASCLSQFRRGSRVSCYAQGRRSIVVG